MVKFQTHHFGEISYDPKRVITFPDGLPGFPLCKQFLLMSENEDENMFFWLQSVEDGDVAFTLMNVYNVLPEYDPQVEEDDYNALDVAEGDTLLIYNIVVIPEYVRSMRVNLLAPVVINVEKGLGRQVICANEDYPIRFMIFEEFERFRRQLQAQKGTEE